MVFVYSTAILKPLVVPFEPSNNQFFFFSFSLSILSFFFYVAIIQLLHVAKIFDPLVFLENKQNWTTVTVHTSTNRDQITSPRVAEPSNLISFTWKYPLTSLQLPPGLVPRVSVLLSYNFKIILIFASKKG